MSIFIAIKLNGKWLLKRFGYAYPYPPVVIKHGYLFEMEKRAG